MPEPIIILPTFNERENIEQLLPVLLAHPGRFHILVVDDGSPDGTGEWVKAQHDSRVHLIQRAAKAGLGTAYLKGFRYALDRGYDPILEMDADFSHKPEHLADFLQASEHHDFVVGSRYIAGGTTPNWPWHRRILSKGGNWYTRVVLGIHATDATSGFRCYRRRCLADFPLDQVHATGFFFQVEMLYRLLQAGFQLGEIPIQFEDRRAGQSKISLKIILEGLCRVWTLRFSTC